MCLQPLRLLLLLALSTTASAKCWWCAGANFSFSPASTGGVLQTGEPAAVWGFGAAVGAPVAVTLHTMPPTVSKAVADSDGAWSVTLPPQKVAWDVKLTARSGSAAAATNVSVGAVVLCAGQSNMDMPVACHVGTNRTKCFHPKRMFHADNGTAEVAAAGAYAGKVWMIKAVNSKYELHSRPTWKSAVNTAGAKDYPAAFSAVCWYSGKALFEKLGGATPVGLLQTSVGGSPIEYWLPPSAKFNRNGTTNVNACESDRPQCDNKYNDTFFFTDIVTQLVPYTHGAMVWDQAERDVKCPTATSAYACMQALLATSWRREFKSASAAFVAVQLPGYTGALNNGTGSYPGYISAEMVWKMRLQQAKGAAAVPNASVVVTYDESCSAADGSCPYGSVHNVQKGVIGERIAEQLLQLRFRRKNGGKVRVGPRALSAKLHKCSVGTLSALHTVVVTFDAAPRMSGTKNCTVCCGGSAPSGKRSDGHTLDFDASASKSGGPWVNGTGAVVDSTRGSVSFTVALPGGAAPKVVRYTAASIFPECALRGADELPALPFQMEISSS